MPRRAALLEREPEALPLVLEEISAIGGKDPCIRDALDQIATLRDAAMGDPSMARVFVEQLALAQAAALFLAQGPRAVSDAFIATRLGAMLRRTYGAGVGGFDARAIVDRAGPDC